MMKKKGSALVTALITIIVIFVLASTLLSFSLSSYKASTYIEQSKKLKLTAESGIDKAYNEMKNYIVDKTDILLEPKSFDPVVIGDNGVLLFEDDNIENKVTLKSSYEDKITDVKTGKEYYYIKVKSMAKNKKTNETVTLVQYIDRSEILNPYFNRMFNSAFSVISPLKEKNTKAINGSLNNIDNYFDLFKGKLNISGDVFIQKNNIVFKPSGNINFFEDTNLYLKGENIEIDDSENVIATLNGGLPYEDNGKIEENQKYWKQLKLKELKNLGFKKRLKEGNIEYKDFDKLTLEDLNKPHLKVGGGDIQVFDEKYKFISYEDILMKYENLLKKEKKDIKKEEPYLQNPYVGQEFVNIKSNSDNSQLLIEFKGRTKNGEKIDFNKLINGGNAKNPYKDFAGVIDDNPKNNDGIYEHAVEELRKVDKYKDNYLQTYGNVYKLIIIDGDLVIPNNSKENFINYIIYCTGTVTFEGISEFYNSSIFAKNIILNQDNNLESNKYNMINFNGVNSYKSKEHIVNELSEKLTDFTPEFKGFIHKNLINSLDGYKEALEFNVIKTEKF